MDRLRSGNINSSACWTSLSANTCDLTLGDFLKPQAKYSMAHIAGYTRSPADHCVKTGAEPVTACAACQLHSNFEVYKAGRTLELAMLGTKLAPRAQDLPKRPYAQNSHLPQLPPALPGFQSTRRRSPHTFGDGACTDCHGGVLEQVPGNTRNAGQRSALG